MSLYGLMRTSTSGMTAQANRLSAVADNIANSNTTGYKKASTEFSSLLIDSTPLANGVMDSRFTVQDKDSTMVTIPVAFSWSGLGAGVRSVFNTGAVNYRVNGDVTVGTPVGNFTIPYSQTGRYSTLGR